MIFKKVEKEVSALTIDFDFYAPGFPPAILKELDVRSLSLLTGHDAF